jgi:uncharacterized membrane protein YdbT with pleckstrin-like domain
LCGVRAKRKSQQTFTGRLRRFSDLLLWYGGDMSHPRHRLYWRKYLLPDERSIHTFGVSGLYITMFWIVPMLLVFIAAGAVALFNPLLGLLLTIPALGLLIPTLYQLFFIHYAITDQRMMEREGIFHKRFITVDFGSVTDVFIHEPFLERLLTGTGTLGVNTAGGPRMELIFNHVRRPYKLRNDIYHHLQEAIHRTGQPRVRQTHTPQH